jgi:serine/threonine-protein kinase
VRFDVAVPGGRTLGTFALSPDGERLVYSAESESDRTRRLFVRVLTPGREEDRELAGTPGAINPFFSPDGAEVAYFSRGVLWRTRTDGRGDPQRIADAPADSAGGTWTEGGRIVFAPLGREGLMQVPAAGGIPAALTDLVASERELAHEWPHALPGGALVFTVSQRGRDAHLEVLSPEGKRSRLRVPIAGPAQFVASGHLAYGYLGNLMAVRFDREALGISGIPQAIGRGLGRFSVSPNGTLAWVRSSPEDGKSILVRVGRDGGYEPLSASAEAYQTPRLSPDGRRLAVVVRPDFMTREIRVLDAARLERVLFTLSGGDNQAPAWMDNRRLTFGSNRDGLQKIYVAADAARVRPLFTADVSVARNPAVWSRPPRVLALYEIEPARGRDVLLYRVGESIAPVAAGDANERSPALSPDGRWIAFVSDASGRDEVYVKPLDGSMEAVQLTSRGAVEPVWTREGLFYRDGDTMMLADLRSGLPGTLRSVFEGYFVRDPGANLPAYDVDPQGNFVMLKSAHQPRALRVVRNWDTELLAQLPVR